MSEQDRTFLARYGATILRGGIAAIPAALLRYQGELGLSAPQTWFICAILSHRWSADLPHPSLSKMAEQTGLSRRQLQLHRASLIDAGWLRIVERATVLGGQAENAYDFTPLFAALEACLARDAAPQDTTHPPANYISPPPAQLASPSPRSGLRPLVEPSTEPVEVETDRSSMGRAPRFFDDDERATIRRYVEDFAHELGDGASVAASTTRAANLLRASDLSLDQFIAAMLEARSRTQERTASIRSADDGGGPWRRKRKMPYFFAVLEQIVSDASDDISDDLAV